MDKREHEKIGHLFELPEGATADEFEAVRARLHLEAEQVLLEDRKKEVEEKQRLTKATRQMRIASFFGGCGCLVLSVVDAIADPFPGLETFFALTGVSLVTIGVTGKMPKKD